MDSLPGRDNFGKGETRDPRNLKEKESHYLRDRGKEKVGFSCRRDREKRKKVNATQRRPVSI